MRRKALGSSKTAAGRQRDCSVALAAVAMSDDTPATPCYVAQLCVGSVIASTGLIILNKTIVQFYGFHYGAFSS